MSVNQIVGQATYKYKMGQSLKSIYDDFCIAFGSANGAWYFSEFVVQNKSNKAFISEFNKTCFTQAAHVKIGQTNLF